MPTGTLIRKIQCQLMLSVIQPPSVGPSTGPHTTTTPYAAKAWPRISGGKVSARIACSAEERPPPPSPCTIRARISKPRLGASPHSSEATVNTATEII